LDKVRGLGPKAHVAFITNRDTSLDADTIANMEKLGLYRPGDIYLGKAAKDDTKDKRRECLISGKGRCEKWGPLALLALVGDQIRDFVEVTDPAQVRELRDSGIPLDPAWGERYFVIPNPMYGDWIKLP